MKRILALILSLLFISALSAKEENVWVEAPDCTLRGTLSTPDAGSDMVVLIIAGSGPTDRNGNSPLGIGANSYGLLARFLASEGIASLRYDKRAIGASTLDPKLLEQVVLEDFIDDARLLARYLKQERGFGRVVLAGHSEGGMIALATAAGNPNVDAVITLCGPGYPMGTILKKQIGRQTEHLGLTRTLRIYGIVDSLKAGHTPSIPSELNTLFPPSVLPFLISSLQYDPAELASHVEQPLLIVGGERDLQIGPENGEALKRAQPAAELVLVEGMTHPLKASSSSDMNTQLTSVYRNGDLPLCPGLEQALLKFLHAVRP